MLSGAAHNKPWLVADQLEGVLPRLYAQTVVDESLIRIVDLGPFKHRCVAALAGPLHVALQAP